MHLSPIEPDRDSCDDEPLGCSLQVRQRGMAWPNLTISSSRSPCLPGTWRVDSMSATYSMTCVIGSRRYVLHRHRRGVGARKEPPPVRDGARRGHEPTQRVQDREQMGVCVDAARSGRDVLVTDLGVDNPYGEYGTTAVGLVSTRWRGSPCLPPSPSVRSTCIGTGRALGPMPTSPPPGYSPTWLPATS